MGYPQQQMGYQQPQMQQPMQPQYAQQYPQQQAYGVAQPQQYMQQPGYGQPMGMAVVAPQMGYGMQPQVVVMTGMEPVGPGTMHPHVNP